MPPHSRNPINGFAAFAAAAFAIGLALLLALERVGAPDAVVQSVGPVLALAGLLVIGVGAHNSDLRSFLAARRAVPPLYGALGLAAVAAGVALCLDPSFVLQSDPPLIGVFGGVALAALVYGPLLRRFGATSVADIAATRFSRLVRAVSAIVFFLSAALTAFAGYRLAVPPIQALLAPNLALAESIAATTLFLGVAPGGLTGVIWGAAASGGMLAMIIGVGFASVWRAGVPVLQFAPDLAGAAHASPAEAAAVLATAFAVAGSIGLDSAPVASPNEGAAAKAGAFAIVFCVLATVLANVVLKAFSLGFQSGESGPSAASLTGAATLVSALALARAGVLGASRAVGFALAEAPRAFPTLASVRLARMRLTQFAVVAGCVAFDRQESIDPRMALAVALALSLALTTPIVALAAVQRAGSVAAAASFLAALAAAARPAMAMSRATGPTDLFETALGAAAAAVVAGLLTSLVFPRRGVALQPDPFDPYAEASH
jgi:cation/acetate symporter